MYKILVDGKMFTVSQAQETAVINPVINLEMNKAGTFVFTIPPNHPKYGTIKRKSSIIEVERDGELLFSGICQSISTDFFKQQTISCEGELTFLNDSKLRPRRYQGYTAQGLLSEYLNQHNLLVEEKKRFTLGQVTVHDPNEYISCYTNYNSTMTAIKEDLIDDLGGFLRTRHENGQRLLDYLAESPRTSNQVIRLSVNLLDLSTNLSAEDIATVIIPLGSTLETQSIEGLDERLTIKTASPDEYHDQGTDYVYSSAAVTEFGRIEKVVIFDGVTTAEALKDKGEKYLREVQFENLVITAKALDLGLTDSEFNKFKLYDLIRVVSEPHGLDRYFMLSKMQINLNEPEKDSITLGISENNSLSAKASQQNEKIIKEIEQMPTSNQVKAAIENATALLTGAEGGYVVYKFNQQGQPTELRIQDAIEQPQKIWRWNQNGLGYSNNGGQSYELAMTKDGSIVANFITSGVMTADHVRGGDLLVGGSGVAADGQITVKDLNNNTIASLNRNGLDVKKGSIRGANLQVGGSGNTDGYIYVRDSYGNIIATLDRNGLFIYDTSGNTMARLNQNGLYCKNGSLYGAELHQNFPGGGFLDITNGEMRGGVNGVNTGYLTFNAYVGSDLCVMLRSDHDFVINAERILVGTNSGTVYWTENNRHLFSLPTYIDSNGVVRNWQQGCSFVNGMLLGEE